MSRYAVRRADLNRDRSAIIALWTRNLTSHDAATHAAKFDWYYRQNPLGEGVIFVIETQETGDIVGVVGMGHRPLWVRGEVLRIGLASDFAVDKEHRSLGPAMMLQRALLGMLGDGVELIYALPNAKAIPVYKVLRYRTDTALMRYVRVLSVGPYLARLPGPALPKRIAAIGLQSVLRLTSRDTWRQLRGRCVVEMPAIDERFDCLWLRARMTLDIGFERKSAFLRWRYVNCPITKFVILGLIDEDGGRLHGYAACVRGETEQLNLVDVFYDTDQSSLDDLMTGVLRWARANGCVSVACEVNSEGLISEGLARFGFRHRGAGFSIVFSPQPPGTRPVDVAAWTLLQADEDYN